MRKTTLKALMSRLSIKSPPVCGVASRAAFTLVEMMVVVLIMALLIGLMVRTLGGAGTQAEKAATAAKLEKLKAALEEFFAEYGQYPPVPFYKVKDGWTYYDPIYDPPKENDRKHPAIQPIELEYPVQYVGKMAKFSGTDYLTAYNIKTDNEDQRLFTLGLCAFLMPRYKTVCDGSEYLASNQETLKAHEQWKPYTPSQADIQRDLNAAKRWEPFLDGVTTAAGFDRGKQPGDHGEDIPHHINQGYTIVDSWNNPIRYESLPPHHSYRVWSCGPNGKDEEGRGDDIGMSMNK